MTTEKLVELAGIKSLYELRKLQGHIRVNMSFANCTRYRETDSTLAVPWHAAVATVRNIQCRMSRVITCGRIRSRLIKRQQGAR